MQPARERRTVGSVLNKLIQHVNADSRRLRVLEEENVILKTRLASMERNMLAQRSQMEKYIHDLEVKIEGLENRGRMVENTIKEMIKEIKKLASMSKVKELESLINMYNPLTSQFVTREEAERMLQEKGGEKEQE
jgi:hypothetical protein